VVSVVHMQPGSVEDIIWLASSGYLFRFMPPSGAIR
jgi:hypothetical protein